MAAALAVVLSAGATAPAAAVIVPQVVPAASSGLQATVGKLGARPGATRVPVAISDHVSASVDVGTGNLMVQVAGLSVPGVTGDTVIGLTGNSLSQERSETSVDPQRFELTAGAAGSLSTVSNGMLYEGPDGYAGIFTAVSGSTTAYTSPDGLKADLVKTSTGYTLTWRQSATVVEFNADGKTVSVADRNGNKTTYAYSSGKLTQVVGTRGITGARTATLAHTDTGITVSQSSSGQSRSVSFELDPYNDLNGFVDAEGKYTEFETWGGQVRRIVSPTGAETKFSYDANDRVTKIEQLNTTAGSPGTSITRIAYPLTSATWVADPNTDQAVPVADGRRTTYSLDPATKRVITATDPMGRSRGATYTPDFDTASVTAGSGSTGGRTDNTFGANDGESLTKTTSPGGASAQAGYDNTAANTKYLATSITDDASNKSLYTFNGAGNPLTATDAMNHQATLTYNGDGTVATATAPGNGTNSTKYAYDTNKQLIKVTPPTGTSLGVKDYTYDAFGRLATATDGDGVTTTYTYDKTDRMTGISFSDTTPAVSTTYNDNGQPTQRVDGSGTTTYGYDQLGRLITRQNTAGGGQIAYAYDKAGNLTSTTDSRGTTSYAFDASGEATTMTYQLMGAPKTMAFATDNRGQRTDTWLDANADRTSWVAHSHTDYDTSGRVSRVTAKRGTGNTSNTTVFDMSYCYLAGSTPGTCSTSNNAVNDRAKLQWTKDHVTGAVTTYTYDKKGQLTQAVITGGPSPATHTYTYDDRGNRKTATASTPYPAQNYSYNAGNQNTSAGFAYDGTGNLTADPSGASFTYNGAQQMTKVTRAGTTYNYTYAGADQVEALSMESSRGNYQYAYGRTDQFGQPIIERVTKDGGVGYVENDPVTGQALSLHTPGGMQSMYVYDGIGNPVALITNANTVATAYSYDPYGVAKLTTDSGGQGTPYNPYQFKGGIHDRTTNWVKFGQRWYSTEWGRFTQQDTLDAPLDPANANRYAFAGNDPINLSDPTGQAIGCDEISWIVGTGLGLALIPVSGGSSLIAAGTTLFSGTMGYGAGKACQAKDKGGTAPLMRDQAGYVVNPSNGSRFRPGHI